MTAPIAWELKLDTKRDGTFGASIDDITAYVINDLATGFEWTNGFTSPSADITAYDDVAPPARLTLRLENDGEEFNTEALGSEKLTNGNFATWSGDNPSSWTVSGESGSNPEISQVSQANSHGGSGSGACNIYTTGTTVSIAQTVLTSGLSYQVTLTVSKVVATSGGIQLLHGSTVVPSANYIIQKEGDYTFYFNATSPSFKIQSLLACDITIDNVSVKQTALYGKFIYPGALVRLRATYSAVAYSLFYGAIDGSPGSIRFTNNPRSGNIQGTMVEIIVQDPMWQLLDVEYSPPLLTNVTTDQVLSRVFDDSTIRWPYGDSSTLLDVQGTNVLDYTAKLWSHTLTSFETGRTTLDFAGDMADSGKGVSAQGYMRDMLATEAGGRLWWEGRENLMKFHHRLHDALNSTVTATYTQDDFTAMTPAYGDGLVNEITVNYTSREIGAVDSVVWIYKQVPFRIEPGEVRKFHVRYVDPNNDKVRVGLYEGTQPTAGVDWIASRTESGAYNRTLRINVSVDFHASSADVIVSSSAASTAFVTYLQLRGTPFLWQDASVTVRDGDSIGRHQRRAQKPKIIRALADPEFATLLAQDWLRRFKTPFLYVSSVTLNGTTPDANRVTGLARKIGDRITLTDTFTDLSGDYIIVGESHRVSNAGFAHSVNWILKPLSTEQIFILDTTGRDELNSANRLGL